MSRPPTEQDRETVRLMSLDPPGRWATIEQRLAFERVWDERVQRKDSLS